MDTASRDQNAQSKAILMIKVLNVSFTAYTRVIITPFSLPVILKDSLELDT